MSIRYKLLLAAVIPVALLWFVGYRADRILETALERQTSRSLSGMARVAAADLRAWVEDLMAYWRSWAESPRVRRALREANARYSRIEDVDAFLAVRDRQWVAGAEKWPWAVAIQEGELSRDLRRVRALAARNGRQLFPEVFLTDRFGANVAQTSWTSDYRQDDETWWRRACRRGKAIETVRFDRNAGARSVALSLCIRGQDGRPQGVLEAVLDLGRVVQHMDACARDLGVRLILEYQDGTRTYVGEAPIGTGDASGDDVVSAVVPVSLEDGMPPWQIRLEQSTQKALGAVHADRRALLWAIGGATLVGLALVGFGIAQLSVRIVRLARGVDGLARGDLSVRIDERGRDELAALGRGLNEMARHLVDTQDELARQNEVLLEEVAERHRMAARQRAILDSSHEAFVAVDAEGRVTEWNHRAEVLFGWTRDEAEGRPLDELIVPADRRAAHRAGIAEFRESGTCAMLEGWVELRALRKDGDLVPVRARIWPSFSDDEVSWNAFLLDMTTERAEREERAKLESQLLHSSKLEAIGQLAAGIAHEINTPTQYIGDNTRFLCDAFQDLKAIVDKVRTLPEVEGGLPEDLRRELAATMEEADLDYLDEEIPKALEQALEGVQRVSEIVGAMKDFSHSGRTEMEAADLNQSIRSTVTVARNEWKYVADLHLDLDPELPAVPCQIGAINQVVLNLIVNAAHAIAEVVDREAGEKGTITVRTCRDEEEVEIVVADTGGGIPESIRDRVFEPFFTTKEVGKGTGQGLSIAHQVVTTTHGGTLTLETEMGRGTTFRIRLPLHRSAPQSRLEEGVAS